MGEGQIYTTCTGMASLQSRAIVLVYPELLPMIDPYLAVRVLRHVNFGHQLALRSFPGAMQGLLKQYRHGAATMSRGEHNDHRCKPWEFQCGLYGILQIAAYEEAMITCDPPLIEVFNPSVMEGTQWAVSNTYLTNWLEAYDADLPRLQARLQVLAVP